MKTCTTCRISKPLSAFNKNVGRKDGVQSNCRECAKVSSASYYASHKPQLLELSIKNRERYLERNRRYLFEYLQSHPCVDCGMSDIRVLEFDHVRGVKRFGVGKLARHASSIESLQSEIDKCEVRCRNCHQIVTYERAGGSWQQTFLDELT
jgi:hypothetical protein